MIQYLDGMEYIEWIDASIDFVGDIPGLPMPLAIKTSIDASRRLMQSLKTWRLDARISSFNNETRIATIENPKNASIYEIRNVYIEGRLYCELPELVNNNQIKKNFYKPLSNNHLQFQEETSLDQKANLIELVLVPSYDSDGIAKPLFEEYNEGIRYKCIELIYKSPYPNLTNPQMSAYYREQYEDMKCRYLRKPSVSKRATPIASYGGY